MTHIWWPLILLFQKLKIRTQNSDIRTQNSDNRTQNSEANFREAKKVSLFWEIQLFGRLKDFASKV